MGNWPCFFLFAEFVVLIVIGCAVVGCGRCGRDGRVLEARAATAHAAPMKHLENRALIPGGAPGVGLARALRMQRAGSPVAGC